MTAMAQVISHKVVHPDTTGTEGERRERNNLANHANKLIGNTVLEQLLEQLSEYASAGEIDKLFTTINEPVLRSSSLYPLLNTGEELSTRQSQELSRARRSCD